MVDQQGKCPPNPRNIQVKDLFHKLPRVLLAIVILPIPSMYDIFTYIWLKAMVNVGKYTIHMEFCYGLGVGWLWFHSLTLFSATRQKVSCVWHAHFWDRTQRLMMVIEATEGREGVEDLDEGCRGFFPSEKGRLKHHF